MYTDSRLNSRISDRVTSRDVSSEWKSRGRRGGGGRCPTAEELMAEDRQERFWSEAAAAAAATRGRSIYRDIDRVTTIRFIDPTLVNSTHTAVAVVVSESPENPIHIHPVAVLPYC